MKTSSPVEELPPSACQTEEKRLGAALAAFAKRFALSTRQLSHVCGGPACGVSKSTTDRLFRGTAGIKLTSERRQCVANHLREFLSRRGLAADAINKEIKLIFPQEGIVIIPRTPLPFHVQQYFNLRRDPFDPVKSDPRDISESFTTPALDRIIAALEDAINYQGFCAVVGSVGSGKTQLKKRLVEKVNNSNGRTCLLFPDFSEMKRVNSGAVVTFVLESFGQKPRRGLVAAYEQMRQHLAYLSDQGTRVALAFDEAHRLNDEELSALKNFWELSSGGYQRYLGVVLFGQKAFKSRLEDSRFREIAERVEIIDMPGLGKHSYDYLAHRIRLAGGDIEKIFERKAVDLLAAQVETPLALGNLANLAMLKAHTLGERKVLPAFIDRNGNEPHARSIRRAS
jgi:type II secretory pathway predicted ATPase ExeA